MVKKQRKPITDRIKALNIDQSEVRASNPPTLTNNSRFIGQPPDIIKDIPAHVVVVDTETSETSSKESSRHPSPIITAKNTTTQRQHDIQATSCVTLPCTT